MTQTPQTTTRLLARVLGPFLVLVPVTAAARAPQMQTMLTDFESNAVIGTGVVWQIGYVGVSCLGLYLTWAGWRR